LRLKPVICNGVDFLSKDIALFQRD